MDRTKISAKVFQTQCVYHLHPVNVVNVIRLTDLRDREINAIVLPAKGYHTMVDCVNVPIIAHLCGTAKSVFSVSSLHPIAYASKTYALDLYQG